MHPLILACFVLSGLSGLALEIVWTRLLEHVFGATTLAISTVLTCFMGGLTLGSWLFGRFADRLRSPLAAYAGAEIVVGACAFLVPELIRGAYPGINLWMVEHLGNSFWLFSLVRFAAVAAVLVVPTTLMGATLPLLSRYVVSREAHMMRVGGRVGALYTANTVGAVSGVFLATFVLLQTLGLATTNWIAGATNICLGITILSFHRRLTRPTTASAAAEEMEREIAVTIEGARDFSPTAWERRVAMGAFFLSGLASMNLQVVWNRAMAMVIGSSVYSFALVLLAFLVGIAAGSAAFSHLSKRLENPGIALALVELSIAVCTVVAYLYMDDLPKVFAAVVTTHVDAYENHVGLVQLVMFGVAAMAVLPATLGMGATFPLTIRLTASTLGRVGRDVGRVYALNTLGAIAGSFLSAFVFVPLFSHYFHGAGMQTTYFVSVGIYAALGVALLAASRGPRIGRAAAAVAAAAACAIFLAFAPGWDPASLTVGVFRLSLAEDALDEESWGDPDIKYYHDGVSTTVSVELWGRHFALKNNGKVDASNGDDMPTQIMVAAFPLLLHRDGTEDLDVAVVGFGSGVTVGTALEFPVRRVDGIELESAVVAASAVFGRMEGERSDPELDVNHIVYRWPEDPATGEPNPEYDWKDPGTYVTNERLRVHNNDGRNFLATKESAYDVIVSEPSNPWITGVSNMFTVESFESSARALKPGGVFGQWVQLYELSPENIRTILRTFASVFPHVALFASEDLSSDTILVGSFEPLELDLARVDRELENPRVAAELERAYVFSASDVFARVLLASRDELLAYTGDADGDGGVEGPINTDDNALIEFAAPRDLISFRRFAGYLATIYTDEWEHGSLLDVLTGLGDGPDERVRNLTRQAVSLLANGRKREAGAFLDEAGRLEGGETAVEIATEIAAVLGGKRGAPEAIVEDPDPTPGMTEKQRLELVEKLSDVKKSLAMGAHRDALERFERIPDHLWRRGGPQLMLMKGYLHFLNADPEDSRECAEAIEILGQLVREHEAYAVGHPEVHYYLGLCHDNALHFDKAVKNVRTYVEISRRREEQAAISQAQARANMEALLESREGTAPIDLPPDPPGAPTTDGFGESPKDVHAL